MIRPAVALLLLLLPVACATSADPASPSAPDGPDGGSGAASMDGGAGGSAAGSFPDASTPAVDREPDDWSVNGHELSAREQAAVRVIADDVVPRLAGDRDARLTFAARGAWWALKEGTWEQSLPAVYAYSNCNSSSGDHVIGPTAVCGTGRAWQVGLAAVQVPGHTVAELETLAAKLYPESTPNAVLADIAAKAGVTGPTATAITASTGSLRASWLLRVPAIGLAALVPQEVVAECIDASKSWCFGSGWDETKKFAPTKAAAAVSVTDLRGILAQLAP